MTCPQSPRESVAEVRGRSPDHNCLDPLQETLDPLPDQPQTHLMASKSHSLSLCHRVSGQQGPHIERGDTDTRVGGDCVRMQLRHCRLKRVPIRAVKTGCMAPSTDRAACQHPWAAKHSPDSPPSSKVGHHPYRQRLQETKLCCPDLRLLPVPPAERCAGASPGHELVHFNTRVGKAAGKNMAACSSGTTQSSSSGTGFSPSCSEFLSAREKH